MLVETYLSNECSPQKNKGGFDAITKDILPEPNLNLDLMSLAKKKF